jgi:cobalt-zinc-cadmium efflux system outer membrane protein
LTAARADRQSAESQLRDRTTFAQMEIAAARADYEAAKAGSEGFDRLTADARSLLDKEEHAFTAGASSLLDVIEATRSLRETEESAVDAKKQWIQAEGRLLAAAGTLLVEKQ